MKTRTTERKTRLRSIAAALSAAALMSCAGSGGTKTEAVEAEATYVPESSADSVYSYVQAQADMGPRNPGSEGHRKVQGWITDRLKGFGADTVLEQRAMVTGPDGGRLPICNIMGRFNSEAPRRVLLLAHYDTRPWADQDADASNHAKPIEGANDGGSGVGALMEIARLVGAEAPAVGVDLLFVDAEDSGRSDDDSGESDLTWCLGTQHWVTDMPYAPGRQPEGAILLDMVGGKDAVFRYEYFSLTGAPALTKKVWKRAAEAGYRSRFIAEVGGAVNDDHIHLLANGIPTVDIIEIGHPETGSFNPTWHTMDDTMENIDKNTLQAVVQTVLNVVYKW